MSTNDLTEIELGTVVYGRDIGLEPENDRFKWVECANVERGIGCHERRWAAYHSASRDYSRFRLCPKCNRLVGRFFQYSKAGRTW